MIGCPKAEQCPYSEIMEWEEDDKTGKATPIFWCEKEPKDCPHFDGDYDCVACAHDGKGDVE